MRRYFLPILLLLVLSAPFVIQRLMPEEVSPAEKDGSSIRLVVVTPHNQDIRRLFASAFDEWHRKKFGQGVILDYRMPGGANDIKRLLETTYGSFMKAGHLPPESEINTGLDIVWGGGDYFFDQELKPLGILKPLELDAKLLHEAFPSPALAGVRLYEGTDRPRWIGICLSSFGIVYNPDLYRTLDLPEPRGWEDLTSPKLDDLVILADPTHSGSAAVAYMVVVQRAMADAEAEFLAHHSKKDPGYDQAIARGWKIGMGRLLLIAANARNFVDSAPLVPNDVGNGEAAAGIAIDFYGRIYQESVGAKRCKVIMPAGATAITPDPIAVLYGVRDEKLLVARHFVEFLLTPEAQRLWNIVLPDGRSLRRLPIRADVYANRAGWADDIDPFTESHGFNQRGEWMTLFGDLLPIWAAAWIDSRDELRDAYHAILKVRDGKVRGELLAELSDLPIEMADVAALRNERKRIEASGSSQLWKAQQRLAWTKRFREHYQDVETKAGKRFGFQSQLFGREIRFKH